MFSTLFVKEGPETIDTAVSQRFALTTTKKGQRLNVSLSPLLLFVVLQSYQWVTVWAIAYKYHSAAFYWIKFSCFMEWPQTAELWIYLSFWLTTFWFDHIFFGKKIVRHFFILLVLTLCMLYTGDSNSFQITLYSFQSTSCDSGIKKSVVKPCCLCYLPVYWKWVILRSRSRTNTLKEKEGPSFPKNRKFVNKHYLTDLIITKEQKGIPREIQLILRTFSS